MVLNTGTQYKRSNHCQFILSFQFNLMIFVSIVLDEAILFSRFFFLFSLLSAIECDKIGAFASNSIKNNETITSCITNLKENTHFPFHSYPFLFCGLFIYFCRNYENFTTEESLSNKPKIEKKWNISTSEVK